VLPVFLVGHGPEATAEGATRARPFAKKRKAKSARPRKNKKQVKKNLQQGLNSKIWMKIHST
jgi:hypothetical protein